MKLVIIGNSAAGLAAVRAIRKVDMDVSVKIISREKDSAYSKPALAKVIAGRLTENQIFVHRENFYQQMKIETILGAEVTRVLPDQSQVLINSGPGITYDQLLIAWGGETVIPLIHGLSSVIREYIFKFTEIEDMRSLNRWLVKGKRTVLLIGGGFINVGLADTLIAAGHRVILVELKSHLLPRMVDDYAGSVLKEHLKRRGSRIITGRSIVSVKDDESGNGYKVRLSNDIQLETDGLIVGTGIRAFLEPLQDTGIRTDSGIVVDSCMRTSVHNIFAAGDVAQAHDIYGNTIVNPIWPVAVEQGEIAGLNMIGKHVAYKGSVQMNSLSLKGLHVSSFGNVTAAENENEYILLAESGDYAKVILDGDGFVRGFIGIGPSCLAIGSYLVLARKRWPLEINQLQPYRKHYLNYTVKSRTQIQGRSLEYGSSRTEIKK